MPVVPGYLSFTLLLAFEAIAVAVWILAFMRHRPRISGPLLLCSHCVQLHTRAEVVASLADAVSVGALSFLVALPFVVAGFESGFTLLRVALVVSVVLAVLALGAELNFLLRAVAGRLLPQFSWRVEPARLIGSGARWLGVVLALYLFQRPDLPGRGLAGLFGGVGERLVVDLPSTSAIYTAAAILLIAAIVALASRWLIPFALNSLPIALASRREPGRTT